MKTTLNILTLLITVFSINAQIKTLHNFNLTEDLTVNYQHIFNIKDVTAEDFKIFLSKKNNLKNITTSNNTITGQITDLKINHKKYQADGPAAAIFLRDHLSANFIIEIKDNKYRITLTNIVFTDRESLNAYNTDNVEATKANIEDLVVKKKKESFKSSKSIVAALSYSNQFFMDFFKYRAQKSDW